MWALPTHSILCQAHFSMYTPLPHYHHGNLKDALLSHAMDCLDAHGRHEFSMRHIAKQAGVSHNAPYRHFPDKQSLIIEMQNKISADLIQNIESVPLLYPSSALLQIQSIGQQFSQLATVYPERMLMLMDSYVLPQSNKTKSSARDRICLAIDEVITEAISQKLIRHTDPKSLTFTIESALFGFSVPLAYLAIAGKKNSPTSVTKNYKIDQFDVIAENILHGFLNFS
jgi:AcrR family transcriptional regulator